jgi:hypothetical protein
METMEYYIGSRSCELHPSLDPYLGSMKTWNPDKSKLIKTIIKMDFSDRESANVYERDLIISNLSNSLNKNKNIPGIGFHTVGMVQVKDSTGKCFLVSTDSELLKNGSVTYYWSNKKHTDVAIEKMSESAKNRKITEEMENYRREKISKTLKGVSKSKEFCENMAKTRKGDNNPYSKYLKDNNMEHHSKGKKYEKTECPHCNRMISISVIHVAHLDNCKYKINGKG